MLRGAMGYEIESALRSISEKAQLHQLSEPSLQAFLKAVKKVAGGETGA